MKLNEALDQIGLLSKNWNKRAIQEMIMVYKNEVILKVK
jgi:hypothetical protein